MAVKDILEYPDDRLRLSSTEVVNFDDSVAELAHNLIDTLHASASIALSAPQLDDLRQVLVIDLSPDHNKPEIYVNPTVLARKRPALVEESCLSVPGIKVNVLRSTRIRVRAFSEHGERFERDLSDIHAVCLQHEMDHFDGKLLVDRLNWFRRRRFEKTIAGVPVKTPEAVDTPLARG